MVDDGLLGTRRPAPVLIDVEVAVSLSSAGCGGVATCFVADISVLLVTPDGHVLLTAFAAEGERHERLAAAAGLLDLVRAGHVTGVLVLQGDVDGVALGQELVEAEREEGAFGVRVLGLGTGFQGGADCGDAGFLVDT